MQFKKRAVILLLVAQALTITAFAQVSDVDKANEYYTSYNYDLAIPYYQHLAERYPSKVLYAERLADCYYKINDYGNAFLWYEKAFNMHDVSANGVLGYANTLKNSARYKDAKNAYTQYLQMPDAENKERTLVLSKIHDCDTSVSLASQRVPNVKLINETAINSKYSEWGTVVYKNNLLINSDRLPESILKRITNPKNKENILNQLYGWTGNAYLKVYSTTFTNNAWEKPQFFDKNINTMYHNAVTGISPDEKTLCFTRTNKVKKTGSSGADFVNRKEIYFAQKGPNNDFSKIKAFRYNNAREYSIQHPVYSPDGKYLYFSSDMPGGFGKFDLYYCERLNDTLWAKPVNLGSAINTAENEGFPFIASDGMLYFSSDGRVGLGGLDVYSAQGQLAEWRDVQNMLPPYNSSKDDFGFVYFKDKKVGFLASNREGGLGSDDIYRFIFLRPECKVEGVVVNAVTKAPLSQAKLTFTEIDGTTTEGATKDDGSFIYRMKNCTGLVIAASKAGYAGAFVQANVNTNVGEDLSKVIPAKVKLMLKPGFTVDVRGVVEYTGDTSHRPVDQCNVTIQNDKDGSEMHYMTNADGRYHFMLTTNNSYHISALKEGYLTSSEDVNTRGVKKTTTLVANLKLDRLEVEKVVVLKNIYYDLDKYNIRPDAARELNKVVRLMKDNPKIKVELSSHTDNRASAEYNEKLSQKRAEAAVAYIISKGIAKKRLIAKGYGESKPVEQCEPCSEEQYQRNRRTEFKILGVINNVGIFE